MPVVRRNRRKLVLSKLDERITRMRLRELVEYERALWAWMDKAKSPANIARRLNMIHREVEWRAQDTSFNRRPGAVG
jgi:hypothetical protein